MYAHVNTWMMNDAGARSDDTAAREVGSALRAQPGFKSYMVVRTGEWQVVVVTVFESAEQLDAAVKAVAPLVRQRVKPLATEAPVRQGGPVLFHIAAQEGVVR